MCTSGSNIPVRAAFITSTVHSAVLYVQTAKKKPCFSTVYNACMQSSCTSSCNHRYTTLYSGFVHRSHIGLSREVKQQECERFQTVLSGFNREGLSDGFIVHLKYSAISLLNTVWIRGVRVQGILLTSLNTFCHFLLISLYISSVPTIYKVKSSCYFYM